MRAMVLRCLGGVLEEAELPRPEPAEGQVVVRVDVCGVCRTDLHVVDGDLPASAFPLTPGHEIVGRITALGRDVTSLAIGDRVGIPWLGWTCGDCDFCLNGEENLCAQARFTGYQIAGGYAEYAVADHRFCFRIPAGISDAQAAPLLCAGLIGYRAYRMAGRVSHLGLYGFGAAGHILAQLAARQDVSVYAFTRPDDSASQAFAHSLGVTWTGGSDDLPPQPLDAAIIFAPVGDLVPVALRAVRKGGQVICAGIHMSDIPAFPYALLWGERCIRSVANLTRQDAAEFMALLPSLNIHSHVTLYDLADANQALDDLRAGRLQGAAVLTVNCGMPGGNFQDRTSQDGPGRLQG